MDRLVVGLESIESKLKVDNKRYGILTSRVVSATSDLPLLQSTDPFIPLPEVGHNYGDMTALPLCLSKLMT